MTSSVSMAMTGVTESCRLKPAPNPAEMMTGDTKYFPLTLFDTVWLRFPPIRQVFFYQIENLSPHLFYDTILPKLKHSLSLTLQHYPPLAGNLTWHPHSGKPVIRYAPDHDDNGVFLSVAEADSCDPDLDFNSLSADDIKESKHLRSLLPQLDASDSQASILSLHLTLFPGHGFSVGYCSHHASMDGKSAASFLNAFAAISRLGSLPPELKPLLDRSLIHDPSDISTIFTDQLMEATGDCKRTLVPESMKPPPGLFRSTFRLTREEIGQLKAKIRSPVSTMTAICSHIWTCLVKAEEGGITEENVFLLISVDCRSRLDPPVPANYFGNCITHRFAKAKVASLEGDDGIVAAAMAIKEAIGSLVHGSVMEGAEKWVLEVRSMLTSEKVYTFGGSPWLDFYGVDFGWGRPRKVEMVSIDSNGSFFICGDRDGKGGIEVGIVLSELKIQAFASLLAQNL